MSRKPLSKLDVARECAWLLGGKYLEVHNTNKRGVWLIYAYGACSIEIGASAKVRRMSMTRYSQMYLRPAMCALREHLRKASAERMTKGER